MRYVLLAISVVVGFSAPSWAQDESVAVRVATYNVEFGRHATPEEIGEMFKVYKLDIIGFNEAPDGDWTERVGKVLGMKYHFVGKISSANHKDKYKTILSRTPLTDTQEFKIEGRGWNPCSVVKANTKINGVQIAFYSLHISASTDNRGHAYNLATKILPKEKSKRAIVVGDFNNSIEGPAKGRRAFAMTTLEKAGWRPTWRDLKIDLSDKFTWNAVDPKKWGGVIDHILYNAASGAKATDGAIIELAKPLADHKPVWAKIVFPQNAKAK